MQRRQPLMTPLIALVVALAVFTTTACWKRDGADPTAPQATPTPIDLNRDDMAALPGADVDLPLLDQFPHYLRQETALSAEQVFTYYDEFFGTRGWSVEVVNDPIARENSRTHRYSLGDELAFVKVVDRGDGRNDVVLSRRQVRDDERPGYEENEDN